MPRTFAEQFFLEEATPAQRLGRDLRLALFLARTLWGWATVGRRVRRAWREACARGEPLYLEDLFPGMKR